MMPPGTDTEDLAIEHMRKPGERMPIAGGSGGEGPDDVAPTQALLDERVIRDIDAVVEADEIVSDSLEVWKEGEKEERD